MAKIIIALSKGRILKESLALLQKININIAKEDLDSRKLIINTSDDNIKIIIIKPIDVPIFVQHMVADIGIVGKDVINEHEGNNIFELLDLGIAKCKLMIAGKDKGILAKDNLRVATKYANSTSQYFNGKQNIELIKLSGAIELAPIVGISDVIVDLVSTGNTLKANGLKAFHCIENISARLIVNSASFHTKQNIIAKIIKNLNLQIQSS